MLSIVMLGTGGMMPMPGRFLNSVLIHREGEILLFDCGEGTQIQLKKLSKGVARIKRIFISHLHADHVTGLPGMLMLLSQYERIEPIYLYGPPGIKKYIISTQNALDFNCKYEIIIKELKETCTVYEEDEYKVECTLASHTRLCLAYALCEKNRPGRFLLEKAKELGIPEGPLYGKLQRGNEIQLADGRIIKPQQVLTEPRPGRKIVYAIDTRPSINVIDLAKGADVLIHDGMFTSDMEEEANIKGHSTVKQAGNVALKAGVEKLIITHISPRYIDLRPLQKEVSEVFPNSIIAEDLMEFEIPLKD